MIRCTEVCLGGYVCNTSFKTVLNLPEQAWEESLRSYICLYHHLHSSNGSVTNCPNVCYKCIRVITSSLANGPLVLRHELGHSIIDVGEEYDGGFAYFGPNAAQNTSVIPWTHWLTNTTGTPRTPERSVMPMQAYPWTLLNTTTPWSIKFTSSGSYARSLVRFSLSGLPSQSDLRVELDGVNLGWVPQKDIGVDRWHYDVHREAGLR